MRGSLASSRTGPGGTDEMSRVKDLWLTTDKRPTAKYGHGKRWLAVWTGPHRGDRTKAFARKSDAERHLVMMEADQLRGTYVDPRRARSE